MIRIATLPFQASLGQSIGRAQEKLSITQAQLSTGKKAPDLASLGTQAVQTLSARTLLSRQEAQTQQARQLGTTLALYDSNITAIDTMGIELRTTLMTAMGTGDGAALQGAIEGAFAQFRSALNASDGNAPLFGGSRSDQVPFTLTTLADAAGATPATAFASDTVRASARVGDGVDVTFGVTAGEVGTGMLSVFRTLAEAGTIGTKPTDAQIDAFKTAIAQIDAAAPQVRTVNAGNGLRQKQVELLEARGEERTALLTELVSDNEDADYAQLAIDLAQQKTVLQASFSVFSQLAGLSLANYLN